MEEYKSITNEVLCEMAQSGDKDAENELLQRYENRIIQIVRRKKYYIAGFDDDVWIQEGRIIIYKAIRKYKSGNNFDAYINKCILNAVLTRVSKSINNKKNNEKNLSIEDKLDEIDNSKLVATLITPEVEYINAESELEIKKKLSSLEYEIFQYRLKGYSYLEIAKILNKSKKDIDNAIQRSRKKLKSLVSKGE
ncbi:MAG: sigma-70 family RNA polymerase sigma factor [Clostridia bacterium]|nr:sigma-70 family RNA polymerase sigma factor [Clostridia bacterium]